MLVLDVISVAFFSCFWQVLILACDGNTMKPTQATPYSDKLKVQSDMNPAEIAKPLHLQKLEHSLDVRPFLSNVTKVLESPAR